MDKRNTTVAILVNSSGVTAAIALDTNIGFADGSTGHYVGTHDPRCKKNPVILRGFQTVPEAEKHFNEALAVSRDRGWTIAHTDPRNHG